MQIVPLWRLINNVSESKVLEICLLTFRTENLMISFLLDKTIELQSNFSKFLR
jgi:hypothetical protein